MSAPIGQNPIAPHSTRQRDVTNSRGYTMLTTIVPPNPTPTRMRNTMYICQLVENAEARANVTCMQYAP